MTTFRNLLQATALAGVVTLAPQTIDPAQATVVNCNGDQLRRAFVKTRNTPTSLLDNAGEVTLANSTIDTGDSDGDPDTYIVTLSGQADNSTATGSFNVQAQVRVDGGAWTDIDPNGPNTFHQGSNATTASMTWCTRVEAGESAQFRIAWRSSGAGNNATLDDYTVMVLRFD